MLINPQLLSQLAPLELKARHIVEGFISGLHKSPYYGFSVEFAEHRPYNPGDDFKHIDWKAYAKSERFYVKQYEEETNLRAYLLLDTSSSMLYKYYSEWSKLRYAIHFGAALMYLMHRQRDACGLIPFNTEVESFIPAKSTYPHLRMLLTELERWLNREEDMEHRRQTASAKVLHEVAERLKHRSLVIVLSDLFENVGEQDELLSALKHLRHRHHEVILFNIMEKRSERELDLPDKKFVLEDLETGGNIEVLPAQIREDYRKKMEEYIHRFSMACSEAKIDFEQVDSQDAFDRALLAYLNKRKRLG